MALTTKINLAVVATLTKQIASDEYATHPVNEGWEHVWATGTSTDQANSSYHVSGTATSGGGSVTLDFRGGGLTDAFGDAIAFTKIKAVLVRNGASAANDMIVSGTIAAFSGGSEQIVLPGGASLALVSGRGWDVSAGTTDQLVLTVNGGDVPYEVIVIGTR